MSVLAAIRGPRMRLLGQRAAFEKFGLDVQEQALSEGARPGDPAWGREPPERWGRLSTGDDERTVETEPGAYDEFYKGSRRRSERARRRRWIRTTRSWGSRSSRPRSGERPDRTA